MRNDYVEDGDTGPAEMRAECPTHEGVSLFSCPHAPRGHAEGQPEDDANASFHSVRFLSFCVKRKHNRGYKRFSRGLLLIYTPSFACCAPLMKWTQPSSPTSLARGKMGGGELYAHTYAHPLSVRGRTRPLPAPRLRSRVRSQ